MNRVILSALAAALWLVCPVTSLATDSVKDDAAWSRAVNLMALIDLEKDAVKGTWKVEGGTLVSGMDRNERIQIPYQPPEEYDYRIVFSITDGANTVFQVFSHAGHMAGWIMGGVNNSMFGFERIGGKPLRENPTTVRLKNCLEKGRVYTSILSIRRASLKAYLDGRQLAEWKGGYNDAGMHPTWDLPDHRLLGLGTYVTLATFKKIELLEITGKGKVVPHTESTVAKRETEKPKPGAATTSEDKRPSPRVAGTVDADSQKDAKKFARNQSSIKGLYVIRTEAGLRVGGAQDIIATAERASSDRETICDFVTEVGKDTQISMEEAERLLKVRYPVWQAGYKIRFSYSNKYSKQAGGSAGGAFSVLLLSLLDGVPIDPGFAMTGDVTVDGKIREVGAVSEKIRGAVLENCKIIAIPDSNKEDLNDLAVLYSPAMLWSAQLFSIATLDDAAAVARVDRATNLTYAISIFADVQSRLGKSAGVAGLRNAWVGQQLREVLRLAPNHLSAEFMLRAANNQLAPTLSLRTSLDEIWLAATPLLVGLLEKHSDPKAYHRFSLKKVPDDVIKGMQGKLGGLQFRVHTKTRNLLLAINEYTATIYQLMHQPTTISRGTYEQFLAKKEKVLGEASSLGSDRKTLEEMMH
jgi:hypothetical protein